MNNKQLKPLIIIGAGGLGREVAWLVEDINSIVPTWDLLGFLDDGVSGFTVEGYPVLGNIDSLSNMDLVPWVIVAIADSYHRKRIVRWLKQNEIPIATLIHPSVQFSRFVSIDEGSIICAGTILTTNVKLGLASIVNLGCFIGHDTLLNNFVSLMPGVNVAGEVTLGEGVFIGLNACVINRMYIGAWSIIGAGAAVVNNIPEHCLAVGTPAQIKKRLEIG